MITEPGDVSRARALDLLDQQRRRILELSERVSTGQRELQSCARARGWRSPSRLEFEERLDELNQTLARSAGSLRNALSECDRARDLLHAGTSVQWRGSGWESDFVNSPSRKTR